MQTGEVFALRAAEAEVSAGSHGCSMVDLGVSANMAEDKDSRVLVSAPRRALIQTCLQDNILFDDRAGSLSPALSTVPRFCYLSADRSRLSIFCQFTSNTFDLARQGWPMESAEKNGSPCCDGLVDYECYSIPV